MVHPAGTTVSMGVRTTKMTLRWGPEPHGKAEEPVEDVDGERCRGANIRQA